MNKIVIVEKIVSKYFKWSNIKKEYEFINNKKKELYHKEIEKFNFCFKKTTNGLFNSLMYLNKSYKDLNRKELLPLYIDLIDDQKLVLKNYYHNGKKFNRISIKNFLKNIPKLKDFENIFGFDFVDRTIWLELYKTDYNKVKIIWVEHYNSIQKNFILQILKATKAIFIANDEEVEFIKMGDQHYSLKEFKKAILKKLKNREKWLFIRDDVSYNLDLKLKWNKTTFDIQAINFDCWKDDDNELSENNSHIIKKVLEKTLKTLLDHKQSSQYNKWLLILTFKA